MFPSVLLAALGGMLLIADGLPALNVEPGCRAAAKMGDSLSFGHEPAAVPRRREKCA